MSVRWAMEPFHRTGGAPRSAWIMAGSQRRGDLRLTSLDARRRNNRWRYRGAFHAQGIRPVRDTARHTAATTGYTYGSHYPCWSERYPVRLRRYRRCATRQRADGNAAFADRRCACAHDQNRRRRRVNCCCTAENAGGFRVFALRAPRLCYDVMVALRRRRGRGGFKGFRAACAASQQW